MLARSLSSAPELRQETHSGRPGRIQHSPQLVVLRDASRRVVPESFLKDLPRGEHLPEFRTYTPRQLGASRNFVGLLLELCDGHAGTFAEATDWSSIEGEMLSVCGASVGFQHLRRTF